MRPLIYENLYDLGREAAIPAPPAGTALLDSIDDRA
jgi:hypothetical protein